MLISSFGLIAIPACADHVQIEAALTPIAMTTRKWHPFAYETRMGLALCRYRPIRKITATRAPIILR